MDKQEIMKELARKMATVGVTSKELYAGTYHELLDYEDRNWIRAEANRLMNPFNIKFGIGHIRIGAKVRLNADLSGDTYSGNIYEISDVTSNGYQSFLLETTTPAPPPTGGMLKFHVGYVQQIVEQGKGPRCTEVLYSKVSGKENRIGSEYRYVLEECHALNEILGRPNSTHVATHYGVSDAVRIHLLGMLGNGFRGIVDMDSLMQDPGLDTIIKKHKHSTGFPFVSWNKNKLKKWVKKNARRHLWNRKKEREFQRKLYEDRLGDIKYQDD